MISNDLLGHSKPSDNMTKSEEKCHFTIARKGGTFFHLLSKIVNAHANVLMAMYIKKMRLHKINTLFYKWVNSDDMIQRSRMTMHLFSKDLERMELLNGSDAIFEV